MTEKLSQLWEPGRGVKIDDLSDRLILFRFFHEHDVRNMIDFGSWNYDGLLLVAHELKRGKNTRQVPLHKAAFSIQAHELTFGYFSETVGKAFEKFFQ